jgi:signal transduction histidine kinase
VIALLHRALQGESVNSAHDLQGVMLETYLQPVFNQLGKVDSVVGVTIDISERKRAEQQELDLALERERILMLRRFMGDVSHDFKTPLSSIKLSAYMLGKVEDDVDQARHLQVIEMQTIRLEKLMADLFTMSRLDMSETQEFSFGRVDINNLLSNVVIAHEPVIQQRQHTLIFEPDQQLQPVWADRFQLDRVFTNLLINAAHYTPNGGQINVRTHQRASEAIVEFEDNGVGIAPEAQSLVFTRFYRADPARNPNLGGTGVGLAIARKIIDTHGGRIEVESTPGQGSKFTVILPQLTSSKFGDEA